MADVKSTDLYMTENLKRSDSEDEFAELTWTLRDLSDLLSAGCAVESCVVYVDKVSKLIGITICTHSFLRQVVLSLIYHTYCIYEAAKIFYFKAKVTKIIVFF